MSLTALAGDCTTTTTLALATTYPSEDAPLVLEADRTGGSIAAWLDTPLAPSLSAIVANQRGAGERTADSWEWIEPMTHRSHSGVWFVPGPTRAIEAAQAIEEAERTIFPTMARSVTVLADVGRITASGGVSRTLRIAETVIVCHRQATQSAAAASVRIERTAELLGVLAGSSSRLVVAVIGDRPFGCDEIEHYLAAAVDPAPFDTVELAVDELAAAVLGGRRGVSARRFARLPLIRSCQELRRVVRDQPASNAADPEGVR
ncbi:MAG: hypothetical protein ACR2O6_15895 [Ilumatobacteraceae bacterium]